MLNVFISSSKHATLTSIGRRIVSALRAVNNARNGQEKSEACGVQTSDCNYCKIVLGASYVLAAELFGEDRHCAVLSADECADLNGTLVSLAYGAALKNAGYKGTSEAVACTNGVGYLYHRSGLEANVARSVNVATVSATGEDEHLEVPLRNEYPALVFSADGLEAVDLSNKLELFVVNLEDVALAEVFFDHFLAVEVLADVDIEDLKAGHSAGGAADGAGHLRHGGEEAADGVAANLRTLSERAEADSAGLASDSFDFGSPGDVVPSYTFADVVLGNTLLVELHLYGTGGVIHALEVVMEIVLVELLDDLVAEFVIADGADSDGVEAELARVISEVGGGATDLATFGQAVPQGLTEAYYIVVFHNDPLPASP